MTALFHLAYNISDFNAAHGFHGTMLSNRMERTTETLFNYNFFTARSSYVSVALALFKDAGILILAAAVSRTAGFMRARRRLGGILAVTPAAGRRVRVGAGAGV